jgi:predicted transcriptional regulator
MTDKNDSEAVRSAKLVKDLKIITAISLGKDRNKELAKVLDTDKSFTSKKVKELEEKGLISKIGAGKETRYRLNPFHVMQFLQSTVVIMSKKEKERVAKKDDELEEKNEEGNKNEI